MPKHTRRNIAFVIFGVVIVGAMVFLFFAEGKFSGGEIFPLALVGENFGVDCRAWNQMSERGINGVTRTFSVVTVNFDVFTTFELVSTSSSVGNLDLIDTSMRVACDPVFVSDLTFDMVGGTTITRFYATQENGQEILIKTVTRNITTIPRDVLNRDLIIPTGTIRASEIDDKLTSTVENYITRVRTTITADLLFKGSATGNLLNTGTAVVQGILTVKVHNEIVNPPQPVSNFVDLTSVTGGIAGSETIDLANEFSTVVIKVKGELPQWSESEGLPFYDVFTPSGNKFASGIRMTVVTLIDSTTNTFEFIDPSFAIGTSPQLGFWQVTMHSNQDIRRTDIGLPSTDTKVFKVINTKPEGVTCPDGTVVSSIDQCPLPPPPLLDSDGDGIPDVDDLCPFEIGFARNNGCPDEPPPPPPIGTLQDLILSGDIITIIEVVFVDNTSEVTLGSLKTGSITTPTFRQTFGSIIPAQITGTILGGEVKPISEIIYVVFFNLPNPEGVLLTSSDLSHIVTVIESSVSKNSGNIVQLTGETTGSNIIIGTGATSISGWVLGENVISASQISLIAQPLIPEGQSRDADIIISYDGRFTFNKGTDTQTFVITNSEIFFSDFQITSEVIPKVPINCEKQGLLPIKNEFGVVIGCKAPDPNDPDILTCTSNERTSFLCDEQFRRDNCNGSTICIEPDDDGDGFSNFRDGCINDPEDGLQPNPTDGCPQGKEVDPPTPPCPVGQVCKPDKPPTPPDDPVCSETNPDACIFPPEQITLLLIVGGVILIVIGIAVAISRRRAKVFG